jgi:hypothetical protein
VPLLRPLNDKECLGKLHEHVLTYMDTPEARALAAQFADRAELVAFIRTLLQRDDMGDPKDGPRLPCEVSQRLRLPTLDPNCFERLALFLAIALLIEPDVRLTSATMMLDNGLHSFPVEIGDDVAQPVVLDPMTSPPRNAMLAAVYELRNTSPLTGQNLAPWFDEVARNACIEEGSEDCYAIALSALRRSLLTGEPIEQPDELECLMSLIEHEAELFGARGRAAFQRVCRSMRNLTIALDTKRVAKLLDKLASTAEPLASEAIKTALIAKFGPAAGIALKGVDLAIKDGKAGTVEETAHDIPQRDRRHDSTDDRAVSRQRRMRRMTLAFRV